MKPKRFAQDHHHLDQAGHSSSSSLAISHSHQPRKAIAFCMKYPSRNLELCPKCHTSILLTSYPSLFDEENVAKAFCVPPETQITEIQNQLPAASAEKGTLEAQICRIKALLQNLEEHHTQISTYISRARSFIQPSPFRRLPTELLSIIFSYACADFSTENHRTALRLSVVCSYWRSIVTSTPALWTNIFYGSDGRYSSTVAEHYIDRCGQLPLHLEIASPLPPETVIYSKDPDKGVHSTDINVKVLSKLFRAIRQWKIVILRLTNYELCNLHHSSRLSRLVPEIMETLIVEPPKIDYFQWPFPSAPAFSSITFSGCRLNTNIPWEQIYSLTFDEDDLQDLKHIRPFLANAMDKSLRICSKKPVRTYPKWFETFAPLLVQQLTTLILELGSRSSMLDRLLDAVTIPDLQDVMLIYYMNDDSPRVAGHIIHTIGPNDVVNALRSMIVRSKCRLQTFTVTLIGAPLAVPFDDAGFACAHIALLQQCPDLKKLRIIEAATGGPPLLVEELFTRCIGPNATLQELQSLELVWAEGREPPSSLISMLRSRSGRLSLSSVVLGIRRGGEVRREVIDCMKELREQGIKVSLW